MKRIVSAAILDGRWLNSNIQGNVTEDTSAELKDDFGLYVNKEWILQAQIPAGESQTGAANEIRRTLKDRQIALLKNDSLTGHDAELVHKLYAMVSNWDYRNAQGVETAMPMVRAGFRRNRGWRQPAGDEIYNENMNYEQKLGGVGMYIAPEDRVAVW